VEEFLVELAGIPFGVRCRFGENSAFFKDYMTGREPMFFVEPGPEDLERINTEFERMDSGYGEEIRRRSETYLENNAIHLLVAENMVMHDVLLMHGSSLCMDGEGYIFTAVSGTGKSTHTRLWRECFGDRVRMRSECTAHPGTESTAWEPT